jgi:hypothetical protein
MIAPRSACKEASEFQGHEPIGAGMLLAHNQSAATGGFLTPVAFDIII